MREKERKKSMEQLSGVKYTRSQKKTSMLELHQSTLTDHMAQVNHAIDWEGMKFSVITTRKRDLTTSTETGGATNFTTCTLTCFLLLNLASDKSTEDGVRCTSKYTCW